VRGLILKHYYTDEIDEKALYWAAIQGMLRHISPPENPELAKLYEPEEYKEVADSLRGEQVAIGIKSSFNPNDGALTVTEIKDGSPATDKLKPLDRILRIDGLPLKGMKPAAINDLLKGEEGTEVELTVSRDVEVLTVRVERQRMKTKHLIITPLTKRIALVDLRQVTKGVSKEMRPQLEELIADGTTGIILDVRDNPGGVFIEAMRVAEIFLHKRGVLLRTLKRETKLQNYVSDNDEPLALQIVIIVNRNTASSAEILTAALRDHKQAVVIGEKTYGKGVFERTFTLENEYRVKFIVGSMYSPLGKAWQSKGLLPDFAVEQSPKQVVAARKLTPQQRLKKDIGVLTAFKLLRRGEKGE
jgi:carboxyl-terminal processing protease